MDHIYKSVLHDSPQGFVCFSFTYQAENPIIDYTLKEVNDAFYRLTGINRSEFSESGLADLFKQELKDGFCWYDLMDKVIRNGKEQSLNCFNDMVNKWLHFLAFEVDDSHVMIFISDISYQNRPDDQPIGNGHCSRTFLSQISTIPIQGYTADGTVFFWNKSSEDLYGYSSQEAVGQNLLELIVPESMQNEVKQTIEKLFRSGVSSPPEELTLKKKNGELVNLYSNHVIVTNDQGVREMYCIDVDLTDLKRKKALLNMLSVATEQSPATVVITDVHGDIEYVNSKFCELTGYSYSEAIGENPRILKSGVTAPEVYKQLWMTITSGEEWHGEFVNKKKNGDLYYESALIAPIRDDSGEIAHFVGLKEDITGRILAQRSVMQHSNNLAGLLELSNLFASTLEYDDLVRLVVQKAAELLEVESAAIYILNDQDLHLGSSWPSLYENTPDFVRHCKLSDHHFLQKCIIEKAPVHIPDTHQVVLSILENKIINIFGFKSVILFPLMLKEEVLGALILGTVSEIRLFSQTEIDVCQTLSVQAALSMENARLYQLSVEHTKDLEFHNSELEKLNQELINAKGRAEEGDRLKTAFLQNMSHEIRTPMNGVMGFAELLRLNDLSQEKKEEYLSYIISSTQQLSSVVDDILDISRLEAGEVVLRNQVTNISEVLHRLYESYRYKVNPKVELLMEDPGMEDGQLLIIDAQCLTEVMNKLLNNAVKFTRSGSIRFGYERSGNALLFFVEDTGIGVPEDQQELIFQPFHQADMSANRQFGGNGLGLTIASRIIQKTGSEIELMSTPGVGSRFSFSFDTITGDQKESIDQNPHSEIHHKEHYTILVAEDDDLNYLFIQDGLKESPLGCQFECLRAKNGVEAFEKFRQHGFIDLVLMDINMPEMDGFEATQLIKKEDHSVPVIVQTAYALTQEQQKAIESGCDDYLLKPIKWSHLVEKVYHHLKLPNDLG